VNSLLDLPILSVITRQPKIVCTVLLFAMLALTALGVGLPVLRVRLFALAAMAAIVAIFLALQTLSSRLWDLQSTLLRESHHQAVNTAVETHAAMAIVNRFPGLTMSTTGFSMRFANLMAIVDLLDTIKPRVVVELGSGISTLVVAAWMREQGEGSVISCDHDAQWCDKTRRHLERSGLSSFVEVVFAPLREWKSGTYTLKWYDLGEQLASIEAIDMPIVDGPPRSLDPMGMSRLPALDVFASRLSPRGAVVIDDALRSGERALIDAWKLAFPQYEETFLSSLTGLCILQNNATGQESMSL